MKIPEVKLVPKAESPEAIEVLGFQPSMEFIGCSKFGGDPEWIQAPWSPECCGKPMTFYAQLDGLAGKFRLADAGLIYVFVCYECFNVEAELQTC